MAETEFVVEQPKPITLEEIIHENDDGHNQQASSTMFLVFYLLKWTVAASILVAAILLRATVTSTLIKLLRDSAGSLSKEEDKHNQEIVDRVAKFLSGPISFACVLLGFFVFGKIVDLPPDIEVIFKNITKTLLDILVFWMIYGAINPISHLLEKTGTGTFQKEIRRVVVDLIKALVLSIGFLSVLQFWGINVGAFLAGLGLVGMAVALAAQDTMKNLFASLAMFADKSFHKGDWIQTPQVEGIVEEVGLRTTHIRQFDNSLLLIPNSVLANTQLTNFNKCTLRRITWSLPIAGDATAEQLLAVKNGILNYLKNEKNVDQKLIIVNLDEFGENCVKLFCYFFTPIIDWIPFMIWKEQIIFKFAHIIEEAGTKFGVPTRAVLLDRKH